MVGAVAALRWIVVVFFWETLRDSVVVVSRDAVDREVAGVASKGRERFQLRQGGRGEERVEKFVAGGRGGRVIELGVQPAAAEQQLVAAGARHAGALHAASHRDAGAQ